MAVAVASTSEFQSSEGTFVPEDTAVTHETPKEELTQSAFFKNHAKRMERAVKRHAKKVKNPFKKAKKYTKKAEKRNKLRAKKFKKVKSLVKKLVKKHVKKQIKKHIQKHVRKYHRKYHKSVGPTGHYVRGNSKFENAHDRRVDDVDDTTSPWACSLHNSPWFACVPRKGDTTNIHRYRTKSPHGRRTWECSINKSMWYPCKARRNDKIVRWRSKYVAHYPARLKFGKATARWLKKRNLLQHVLHHKRVYVRRKIPNFHAPKGPHKIRMPMLRTRRL